MLSNRRGRDDGRDEETYMARSKKKNTPPVKKRTPGCSRRKSPLIRSLLRLELYVPNVQFIDERCVHMANQRSRKKASVLPTPGAERDANFYDKMNCEQIEPVSNETNEGTIGFDRGKIKTYFAYLSARLTTCPCMFGMFEMKTTWVGVFVQPTSNERWVTTLGVDPERSRVRRLRQ